MAASPFFSFAQPGASPAPPPSPVFGAPAASPSQSPFSFTPQAPQQPQQQPQQQQQGPSLLTNERVPASYNTRWADIHPDSQKALQKIEEKILEYRDESWRLDQCERLYDTAALNKGFELDAARISQELSGVSIASEREQASLHELMRSVKEMMRNTEVAVRSFSILQLRFPRAASNPAAASGGGGSGAAPAAAGGFASQPAAPPVYIADFYSGVPIKPSPFFQQTVAGFESRLGEYRQWVEELERLLLRSEKNDQGGSSDWSVLHALPAVMSNVHDFFIYVAAQVESLHEFLESMRVAFLADQRRRGEDHDPFLEADRRETAKREAAARRVHPSAALKPPEPSSTPGLLGSTPTNTSTPAAGFPPASTPSSSLFTPATSPSLFSQPTLTPATTAQTLSLFPSAPSTPATNSLFAPAPSTSSLFGSGTSSAAVKPKPRNARRK